MTKTQQISALILAATQANGGDIQKGFDAVFGEGAYMALTWRWRARSITNSAPGRVCDLRSGSAGRRSCGHSFIHLVD